jgi:hypothetical protein
MLASAVPRAKAQLTPPHSVVAPHAHAQPQQLHAGADNLPILNQVASTGQGG